jgi:hypothetical protein
MLIEDPASRSLLLPWERPELGGVIRRFFKTLFFAWFHPGRMFASLAARKNRPIARPLWFSVSCLGLSVFVYLTGATLEIVAFFVRLLVERRHFWSAYDTVVKVTYNTGARHWTAPLVDLSGVVITVALMAFAFARFFPARLGTLRTRDMAAALTPVIVMVATVRASLHLLTTVSGWRLMGQVYSVNFVTVAIFSVYVWLTCRGLVGIKQWYALVMLFLSAVLCLAILRAL